MRWFNRVRKYLRDLKRKYLHSWVVTLAFFIFALACFLYAYVYEGNNDYLEFFLSLTSELTGIFLTFLAVNVIIQNAKDRDDLESMSMMFIHKMDYLAWVWLGGKRIFDLEELRQLLGQADGQDKLYAPTQNLALALGNKAFEYRRTKRKYIRQNKYFGLALDELSKLARLRDTQDINPVTDVVQPIQNALDYFTKIVEVNFDSEIDAVIKEASEEGQHWRSSGNILRAEERGSKLGSGKPKLNL